MKLLMMRATRTVIVYFGFMTGPCVYLASDVNVFTWGMSGGIKVCSVIGYKYSNTVRKKLERFHLFRRCLILHP